PGTHPRADGFSRGVESGPRRAETSDMSTPPIGERSDVGYELPLRPRGVGRYVEAVFLSVWLGCWLAGELVVRALLLCGFLAWATGEPFVGSERPLEAAPAVAAASFLVFWLAFWTIGGIVVATRLLRDLWGEDRLVAAGSELRVEWRVGPFRRIRV